MKIKITADNADEIDGILKKANGKATQFTITDYPCLASLARACNEDTINLLGYKSYLPGTTVIVRSGDSVPDSYKYRRKATIVKLYRGKSDWFLIDCKSVMLWPSDKGYQQIQITNKQEQMMLKRLRKGYRVIGSGLV